MYRTHGSYRLIHFRVSFLLGSCHLLNIFQTAYFLSADYVVLSVFWTCTLKKWCWNIRLQAGTILRPRRSERPDHSGALNATDSDFLKIVRHPDFICWFTGLGSTFALFPEVNKIVAVVLSINPLKHHDLYIPVPAVTLLGLLVAGASNYNCQPQTEIYGPWKKWRLIISESRVICLNYLKTVERVQSQFFPLKNLFCLPLESPSWSVAPPSSFLLLCVNIVEILCFRT